MEIWIGGPRRSKILARPSAPVTGSAATSSAPHSSDMNGAMTDTRGAWGCPKKRGGTPREEFSAWLLKRNPSSDRFGTLETGHLFSATTRAIISPVPLRHRSPTSKSKIMLGRAPLSTLVAGSAYMSSWAASIPNTRILPLLPESGIVSLETNTKIALCDSLDNWVAERSSASTGLGARLSNVLTEYSTMSRKGEQFGDRALRGFFTSEFERKVSTEILTPDNLEKFLKEQVGKWKCKDVQKSRKESRTVETRHEQQQEQPPSRARTITEQVQF